MPDDIAILMGITKRESDSVKKETSIIKSLQDKISSLEKELVKLNEEKETNILEEESNCSEGISSAVKYIMENMSEKISVKQLAAVSCMSEATFFRYFQSAYGISPGQFISQKKIEKARKLLLNSRYNVTDVCFELGYNNVSHFIRRFKRDMGMTPKKFQQSA